MEEHTGSNWDILEKERFQLKAFVAFVVYTPVVPHKGGLVLVNPESQSESTDRLKGCLLSFSLSFFLFF
jgi:hypothetical protein